MLDFFFLRSSVASVLKPNEIKIFFLLFQKDNCFTKTELIINVIDFVYRYNSEKYIIILF